MTGKLKEMVEVVAQRWRNYKHKVLLWCVILSIFTHHTIIVTFLRMPPHTSSVEVEWKVFTLQDVKGEDKSIKKKVNVEAELKKNVLQNRKKRKKPKKKRKREKEEKKRQKDKEVKVVEMQGLHYVEIRNNKSDVPPERARFFAPINSIVEEETRAIRTNLDHDNMVSEVKEESKIKQKKSGDSSTQRASHEIAQRKDPLQEKGNENQQEDNRFPWSTLPSGAKFQADSPNRSSLPAVEEENMIKPPVLTPETAPRVQLEVTEDGQIVDSTTGATVYSAAEFFTKAKKNANRSQKAIRSTEMQIGWKKFEGLFGKQMEKERKAYEQAKKSKTKGGFTGRISKVMSQLENFIPDVKPGNQTALNAAYHPFAEYITAFHRKLHPQWGDGYLYSLLSKPPSHPHNNMRLWVKLEFIVNPDGTIEKVTVVRSSGDIAFDVAAIDALYAGQPYPPPPDIIKSYNGKVYMRWGFFRNNSQCGVWNAQPYILPAPASKIKKVEKPAEVNPSNKK